ncbi:hypothetical protein pipiens_018934 [Culex pipiens pipiens]|uniref:Uncharacterized protein n=1 Tax=Culex pipiens pipiens TaxID=38569 RepID=A0ABD1DX78_CULPP
MFDGRGTFSKCKRPSFTTIQLAGVFCIFYSSELLDQKGVTGNGLSQVLTWQWRIHSDCLRCDLSTSSIAKLAILFYSPTTDSFMKNQKGSGFG